MLVSLAARSLSSRLGATRTASLATRATTSGFGSKDSTGVHPAPPLHHREATLDKEREREEERRHSRGNSPGLDESKLGNDPGAEKGPIEKSLHSAKGKIKEAVGAFLCFFLRFFCSVSVDVDRRKKNSTSTPTFDLDFFIVSFLRSLSLSLARSLALIIALGLALSLFKPFSLSRSLVLAFSLSHYPSSLTSKNQIKPT